MVNQCVGIQDQLVQVIILMEQQLHKINLFVQNYQYIVISYHIVPQTQLVLQTAKTLFVVIFQQDNPSQHVPTIIINANSMDNSAFFNLLIAQITLLNLQDKDNYLIAYY